MSGAASIASDFKLAVARLAEADDPALTRAGEAIARWLAGEDFDSAAGLAPGWRRHLQQTARDSALGVLISTNPDLDDLNLSRKIVAGIQRAARTRGVRPDGDAGLFHDLARIESRLSVRQWRRLIGKTRGQLDCRNGHDAGSPLLKLES
jgi:hypothetical protein